MLTSKDIFLAPSFSAILLTLGWCSLFASFEVVDAFSTPYPQSSGAASFLKARGHFFEPLSSSSPNTVGGAMKKDTHHWALAPTKEGATNGETPMPAKLVVVKRSKFRRFYKLPSKAYHIYTDYATRLWTETNTDARKRIANDKVKGAIRNMCHVVKSDEYIEFSDGSIEARDRLLKACDNMLETLPKDPTQATSKAVATTSTTKAENLTETPVKKKKANGQRSVLFGAIMGAAVACWVFSGNYVFTGLFALMTILGQLEYYRMVMNTGVYPARRISVVGAVSCFLTVSARSIYCISNVPFSPLLVISLILLFLGNRLSLHQSCIKSVFPCLVCGL
jgi:hypothetical protein